MMVLRRFPLVWAAAALAALAAPTAHARSTRNTDRNRNTGPYRLIGGDKRDDRGGKRDDEARDTKKPQAPKRPEAPASPTAPKPPTTVARPTTPARPATPAPKPTRPATGTKTNDAREQEATRLMAQATAELGKGTEEGLLAGAELLREILAAYGGTDAAAIARQQLDLLLGDPKLGPMILLAEAQAEFDAMRYRKARNRFQTLAERYPDSEQAATARERLAEIERDGLLKKSLYTDEELEDARLWFLAGNIHLENGRKAEAASAYRRVIEEYPGCRFATLAEEKLPDTRS